jgi:hypothetical protein
VLGIRKEAGSEYCDAKTTTAKKPKTFYINQQLSRGQAKFTTAVGKCEWLQKMTPHEQLFVA